MKPSAVITDAIVEWKKPFRQMSGLVLITSAGAQPYVRVREALCKTGKTRRYMAVALTGDWCIGLATAEHYQPEKRVAIVTRHIREGVPITHLPGPFIALAMSEGEGVLSCPEIEFTTQDGEL